MSIGSARMIRKCADRRLIINGEEANYQEVADVPREFDSALAK